MEWKAVRYGAVGAAVLGLAAVTLATLLTYHFAPCPGMTPKEGREGRGLFREDFPIFAPPDPPKDLRLPRHLFPLEYHLRLMPKFDPVNGFPIDGRVEILVECRENGRNVTLHARNMTFYEVRVLGSDREFDVLDVEYDNERSFVILHLDQDLVANESYAVLIEFRAELTTDLAGLYRSTYREQNFTRYLAVTQFQATDARRAFPCFDEPNYKAKFRVALGKPEGPEWVALSNMNSSGTTPVDELSGYVWEQFETSVPMSTYLVAFAVARFESIDKTATEREIPFKVWARPDMIDYGQKAAEYGPAILEYFERYFNIGYPMPKMDMIALPDFAAGAMENWGLITYREEYLLYEESQTPAATLARIVYIIAHELAHMWFGDLVTPEWWNDLWLNEGFASYVEYLGANEVEPGWKWMQQFVFSELQDVLYLDSLQNSHPISVDVYNPDQITEIFDRISYAKGASIIRMMNHFLTEEVFTNGVSKYLKEFEYQNAVQDDLWEHLNDEANTMQIVDLPATVKEVMDTWTLQTGYPVVNAMRDGQNVTVNQKRFLLDSTATEETPTYWYVPLNLVRSSNVAEFDSTNATVWLYPNASSVEFTLDQDDEWYIINAQQTGYYRVNYDEKNWEALNKTLSESHEVIHVINRAQILDDALNLARAGLLNYTIALSLTQYLGQEKSYIPWATTADNLSYLRRMLETSGKYEEYRAYILSLIKDVLSRDGFNFPELHDVPANGNYSDVTEVMYNELIWGAACQMGEPRCHGHATEKFRYWKGNYSQSVPDQPFLNPNIKGLVYCEGVRSGTVEDWDFVYEHYNKTNYAAERTLLLAAMACTKESWLLNKYLYMLLDPVTNGIRSQDVSRAFAYIAANPIGRAEAFKFVKVNWDHLKESYGGGISALGRFISPFSNFNTQYELELLQTLKRENEGTLGSAARAMDQTIESVVINIEWMNKNFDAVVGWLEANNAGGRGISVL